MKITRWKVIAAVAVLLVGLTLAATAYTVHLVKSPDIGPVAEHADAIFVFAGEDARVDLAQQLVSDGRADVLVLSNGSASKKAAALCGQQTPVKVLCPRPEPLTTRGEARMFGELARANGWHSVIAVTGDYHVTRARLLLERCWDGAVSFAAVRWPRLAFGPLGHEVGGLAEATVERTC